MSPNGSGFDMNCLGLMLQRFFSRIFSGNEEDDERELDLGLWALFTFTRRCPRRLRVTERNGWLEGRQTERGDKCKRKTEKKGKNEQPKYYIDDTNTVWFLLLNFFHFLPSTFVWLTDFDGFEIDLNTDFSPVNQFNPCIFELIQQTKRISCKTYNYRSADRGNFPWSILVSIISKWLLGTVYAHNYIYFTPNKFKFKYHWIEFQN